MFGVGLNIQHNRYIWKVHSFLIVMLTILIPEQAFPVLTMEDATKSNPEMRRWSVQGDNNLCEPDNSPVNLAAHVQLAWTPHKSWVHSCLWP